MGLVHLRLDEADSYRTFEDGHVDVGADLGNMAEARCRRWGSAALQQLQVIAALPAGLGQQGHRGGEGHEEEETQHGCTETRKTGRTVPDECLKYRYLIQICTDLNFLNSFGTAD